MLGVSWPGRVRFPHSSLSFRSVAGLCPVSETAHYRSGPLLSALTLLQQTGEMSVFGEKALKAAVENRGSFCVRFLREGMFLLGAQNVPGMRSWSENMLIFC